MNAMDRKDCQALLIGNSHCRLMRRGVSVHRYSSACVKTETCSAAPGLLGPWARALIDRQGAYGGWTS